MNIMKNFLTVIFSLICMMVCISSIIYIVGEVSTVRYQEMDDPKVDILDVQAEVIEAPYQPSDAELYDYYRLRIMVENKGNYGCEGRDFYLNYSSVGDDFYYVAEQRDDADAAVESVEYIPAAKNAVVYRTIVVEKECDEIEINYLNQGDMEKTRIRVKLR